MQICWQGTERGSVDERRWEGCAVLWRGPCRCHPTWQEAVLEDLTGWSQSGNVQTLCWATGVTLRAHLGCAPSHFLGL